MSTSHVEFLDLNRAKGRVSVSAIAATASRHQVKARLEKTSSRQEQRIRTRLGELVLLRQETTDPIRQEIYNDEYEALIADFVDFQAEAADIESEYIAVKQYTEFINDGISDLQAEFFNAATLTSQIAGISIEKIAAQAKKLCEDQQVMRDQMSRSADQEIEAERIKVEAQILEMDAQTDHVLRYLLKRTQGISRQTNKMIADISNEAAQQIEKLKMFILSKILTIKYKDIYVKIIKVRAIIN